MSNNLMKELEINDKNVLRAFKSNISGEITKGNLAKIKEFDWTEYMAEEDPDSWDGSVT